MKEREVHGIKKKIKTHAVPFRLFCTSLGNVSASRGKTSGYLYELIRMAQSNHDICPRRVHAGAANTGRGRVSPRRQRRTSALRNNCRAASDKLAGGGKRLPCDAPSLRLQFMALRSERLHGRCSFAPVVSVHEGYCPLS